MKLVKLFTLVAALFFISNTAFSQTTDTKQLKSATIKVKGVTCSGDLKTIAGNVEKLEGVASCVAEKPGATTIFEVKFNPTQVTEKQIYAAIEGTEGCKDPRDRPYKVKQ
jgi:copper chaperone CopZ